jgi:hypothetical protein
MATVVTSTKVIEAATRHSLEADEVDINLQEGVKHHEGATVAHTKANLQVTVKFNQQRNLKEGATMVKEELLHLVEAKIQANGVLIAKAHSQHSTVLDQKESEPG